MAMHREDGLVRVGNTFAQVTDQTAEMVWDVIADRIRNIQGGCPGLDHGLQDPAKKIQLGTPGILRGEFDVVGVLARPLYGLDRLLHHLIRLHAQFHFHMNRRGRDKGMNASGIGLFDRLAGAIDVLIEGTGQPTHGTVFDGPGHGLDGFKITRAGNGKTRLDDIHPHTFEGLGNTHLLVLGHGGTGALFPVAQGGIKNYQFVTHGGSLRQGLMQQVVTYYLKIRVWINAPMRSLCVISLPARAATKTTCIAHGQRALSEKIFVIGETSWFNYNDRF